MYILLSVLFSPWSGRRRRISSRTAATATWREAEEEAIPGSALLRRWEEEPYGNLIIGPRGKKGEEIGRRKEKGEE